ncbi:DUF2889 domain-containing protein [Variovorax sp. KK3]|uniref:DUF2889 domain-containing protein n=1 Tax=Variovorax sp. KK3 TaxID=1855728 RepID=UPI00097BC1CE|nr:DUF2889 domain-containing protein [Variovorax sp. KK3]
MTHEHSEDAAMAGAVTREELHVRRIDFCGFRRSDGLYEVEARLTDRKPKAFRPPSGTRVVPAGEPIHDHGLRVVFDADMVIREVVTNIRAFPYRECEHGGDALQALVGLRIGPGWNGELRKRLPAADTCTHLKEMMVPLASAAYQAMYSVWTDRTGEVDANGRPRKIDSCYAYGASRELVLQQWPAFHRPADDERGTKE